MSLPHIDPAREASRLRAIASLDLIDTPPEQEFDALAALAAELLDCPIGLVTLVDQDRQWVKASIGTDLKQTSREEAFCAHTIAEGESLVVVDAIEDDRFAENPLVTGEEGIRFYAGTPISARDPQSKQMVPVGAVCAIDTQARPMSEHQKVMLAHLRTVAEALFKARAVAMQAEEQAEDLRRKDRIFRQAERMAEIGSWRLCIADESIQWSEGVFRIYDLDTSGEPPLNAAMDFFPPRDRAIVAAGLAATMETGAPFDVEADFISARGRPRRVRSMGELELRDGLPHAIVGIFQDITERHDIEESLRRSASIDELTRVANRSAFNTELERAMGAARADGSDLALALIDLDKFKAINDTHGHLVGDDVLRAFGRRLRRTRPGAFAARLGGDEFGLILPDLNQQAVGAVVARLLDELKMPVHSDDVTIPVSGTIGFAMLTPDIESVREFAHRADVALYQAKRRERGTAQAWGELRQGDRRAG